MVMEQMEQDKEMNEEAMLKVSLIEKNLHELDEKIYYVLQQISELEEFKDNLKFLKEAKGKNMLSSVGKGVYLKSSCEDSNFFVNIGAGVVLKKTQAETEKIIESQIRNFHEAKASLMASFELYRGLMNKSLSELKNVKNQKR